MIYLFLRGVDAQNSEQGIYTTRPDVRLISEMDALFSGEETSEDYQETAQ